MWSSQNSGDNLIYVLPAGTSNSGSLKKLNSLPKVNEMELISAVVCGRLDPSVMTSAPGNCFRPLIFQMYFSFGIKWCYSFDLSIRYRINKLLYKVFFFFMQSHT